MPARGCSFCGKPRESVRHLVSGPRRIGICDECIELAADVAGEALRPHGPDRLITGASLAVTNDARHGGRLGILEEPSIAIQGGRVTWVGRAADTPAMYRRFPVLDAGGGMVVPAFCDARTSPVAAHREGEDPDVAAEAAVALVDRMVQAGTSTMAAFPPESDDPVAITTGLAIIRALSGRLPVDVQPGWAVGPDPSPSLIEMAERTVSLVTIPVGDGGPDPGMLAPLARRLRRAGVGIRLADTGGLSGHIVQEVAPDSVENAGPSGDVMTALVRVGAAVVVDGSDPLPWARPPTDFLAAGVPVAVATGCDAGGLSITSLPFAAWLAWSAGSMSLEDALWCITRGGALALGEERRGRIAPGAAGDLLVLDVDEPAGLASHPDRSPVRTIVRNGDVLVG